MMVRSWVRNVEYMLSKTRTRASILYMYIIQANNDSLCPGNMETAEASVKSWFSKIMSYYDEVESS